MKEALNIDALSNYQKKGFRWLLFSILLIFVIMTMISSNTDVDIIGTLQRGQPLWLIGGFVLMSCAFIFMSLRWISLMPVHTVHPPVMPTTGIICAGLLLNYAVPGPVGEFASAWFVHNRYNINLSDSLASGLSARFIGLLSSMIIGVMLWYFCTIPTPEKFEQTIEVLTYVIGAMAMGLIILLILPHPKTWLKIDRIVPKAKKILDGLSSFYESIQQTLWNNPIGLLQATFWSVCAHLVMVGGICCSVIAFGGEIHWIGLLFTYTTTTAAAILLFALPGSYLGWDALFFALLVSSAGLQIPVAAAVALCTRIQQFIYMMFGGIMLGWLLHDSRSKIG
jgi:uncharacterized protein (TIRG00374 family)